MEESTPIVTNNDRDRLERAGLFYEDPDKPNMVRIHVRCLSVASNKEYENRPLPPSPFDLRFTNRERERDEGDFVRIPAQLHSEETLVYLGIAPSVATYIYRCWLSELRVTGGPGRPRPNFLTFSLTRLTHYPVGPCLDVDGRHSDEEWRNCPRFYTHTSEFLESIMHPDHARVRRTKSCHHWIDETVLMRYRALEHVGEVSRRRAAGNSMGPGQNMAPHGHRSDDVLPRARPGYHRPTFAATTWTRQAAEDRICSESSRMQLYMARDQAGITRYWSHNGFRGNVHDARALAEGPLTTHTVRFDNEDHQTKMYFCSDHTVAAADAAYMKRRGGPVCAVVVVTLSIPWRDVERLAAGRVPRVTMECLAWTHPHWKQLLWYTKIGLVTAPHLRRYRDATVLARDMARGGPDMYRSMPESELHAEALLYVQPGDKDDNNDNNNDNNNDYDDDDDDDDQEQGFLGPVEFIFSVGAAGRQYLETHGQFDVAVVADANVAATPTVRPRAGGVRSQDQVVVNTDRAAVPRPAVRTPHGTGRPPGQLDAGDDPTFEPDYHSLSRL
ncbi:uncharacterized protein SPSK_02416 [Sporothrix schenckii 1099-18]|uniref:Uncharacterized protein n=1 Tax=Sporothrix schenckii 1099-18 TaxID=1397361 RepID=A0A0F2MAP7_SPOSC|nr:uncharacterized protein SPSK_02416 [Sporothrix schenckii 1099-18]KJR86149.1 hypothetical protein SPSK_02416 [Sporothrix schenckii 1099-18]